MERINNMVGFENSLIKLPKIADPRGCLSVVEARRHIPFDIKRVYYLYNMPASAKRGAHGHRTLEQCIIPMAGSFEISLDNGFAKKSFHLKDPAEGLYIPPMVWRELVDFSSGAVCLVIASDFYNENDYFRNYDGFLEAVGR